MSQAENSEQTNTAAYLFKNLPLRKVKKETKNFSILILFINKLIQRHIIKNFVSLTKVKNKENKELKFLILFMVVLLLK